MYDFSYNPKICIVFTSGIKLKGIQGNGQIFKRWDKFAFFATC